MEDYILREIDKIGKLIEALLQKAGILRRSGAGEAVCETARTELAEALDLDIDTLLAREDFIGVLTREYGFSDENLEKFAELLFDFAAASPDRDATVRLACGITAIYRYLDEKKAPVSLNRYYILKELENLPDSAAPPNGRHSGLCRIKRECLFYPAFIFTTFVVINSGRT